MPLHPCKMSQDNDPYKKIKKKIRIAFPKSEHVLIACSGGADSIFLSLSLIDTLGSEYCTLIYANHQLQKNAHREEQFVTEFATKQNVRLRIKTLPIATHSKKYGLSLEASGHICRKHMFEHVAKRLNIHTICLGHHKDDLTENRVLQLIKGSATRFGRLEERTKNSKGQTLYRPLLPLTKDEISTYLNTHNHPYFQDPSNKDLRFNRNRLRHIILPEIKKINPNILKTIEQLETRINEQYSILDTQLKDAIPHIKQYTDDIIIPLSIIKPLDPILQKRLLFLAYKKLADIYQQKHTNRLKEAIPHIGQKHLEALVTWLKTDTSNGIYHLPTPLTAYIEKNSFILSNKHKQTAIPTIYLDSKNGSVSFLEHTIQWEYIPRPAPEILKQKRPHFLSARKLQEHPIVIRKAEKNDYFQPFNSEKSYLLSRYLKKKQQLKRHRDQQPVLSIGNEIVCVIGIEISEKYKISINDQNALTLYSHP